MEKQQHIIEDKLEYLNSEENDMFLYYKVAQNYTTEDGMYVMICSWDQSKNHPEFNKYINRKVRITIETID